METPPLKTSLVGEKLDHDSRHETAMGQEHSLEDSQPVEHFMSGFKLNILIFGLGIALFLMALDMSVLTTAIPIITEKFHSTEDIGWYTSGYLLTVCSLQPLGGKLYANFSLKWTFLTFFFIFEFGSLLSGAATSSAMLIIGRTIAGAGAAGIMSGTLSILAAVVTLRLRPAYTGILLALFGVATIAGPLVGGALTQHVSWRWVFYINLPVGAFTFLALVLFFNPPVRAVEKDGIGNRIKRLDIVGAILFIPSIVMILIALQWGGISYPWKSATIIGLFVGAACTLAIFAAWELRRGDEAMLPPSILFQRTVVSGSLCAMFTMGAQMILGVWLPEWFQAVRGASPVDSGVYMLPAILGQVVSSIVAGALITRLGYYNPWLLMGVVLMSVGSGLFTTFKPDTPNATWIGFQVIFGLGAGMFMMVPLLAVQAVLDAEKTPVGLSTVNFFQMFGGALFAAISQTIFNERLIKELATNSPGVSVGALLAAGTSAVRNAVTPEQLPGVLQSYNTAILSTYYLGAAVTAVGFCFAWGLEWVNVKGKDLAAGGVA